MAQNFSNNEKKKKFSNSFSITTLDVCLAWFSIVMQYFNNDGFYTHKYQYFKIFKIEGGPKWFKAEGA